MLNKRGQGLQVSTIILIILGVAVLIFLIYGFVVGWSNLTPWISVGNNVDAIVSQCQVACSTNSAYGFCTQQRTLKAEDLPDGTKERIGTCKDFSTLTNTADKSYGIVSCSICP